jgi:ribonuclease R
VGAVFAGRITGVTRFGLFVRLKETGADGLVPIRTIGAEFFRHDERRHALIGEKSGTAYTLGDMVTVRLREAAPLTGGLRFELVEERDVQPKPVRRNRFRYSN